MTTPRTQRSKLRTAGRPSLRSRRIHLERLEDRSLMAVLIGGDAKVSEGIPYQLNLTSDQPVAQWSIDWDGNGSTDQTLTVPSKDAVATYWPSGLKRMP